MRGDRESSSESTSSRISRQLDIWSILLSSILEAIIEIILEKVLRRLYEWGLHKRLFAFLRTSLGDTSALLIKNPLFSIKEMEGWTQDGFTGEHLREAITVEISLLGRIKIKEAEIELYPENELETSWLRHLVHSDKWDFTYS